MRKHSKLTSLFKLSAVALFLFNCFSITCKAGELYLKAIDLQKIAHLYCHGNVDLYIIVNNKCPRVYLKYKWSEDVQLTSPTIYLNPQHALLTLINNCNSTLKCILYTPAIEHAHMKDSGNLLVHQQKLYRYVLDLGKKINVSLKNANIEQCLKWVCTNESQVNAIHIKAKNLYINNFHSSQLKAINIKTEYLEINFCDSIQLRANTVKAKRCLICGEDKNKTSKIVLKNVYCKNLELSGLNTQDYISGETKALAVIDTKTGKILTVPVAECNADLSNLVIIGTTGSRLRECLKKNIKKQDFPDIAIHCH